MSYSQKCTFVVLQLFTLRLVFGLSNSASSQILLMEHFTGDVRPLTDRNFTGFRSAFQWTFDETINKTGLHNAMTFEINDTVAVKYPLFGQIGMYSNGSQLGVHFSLSMAAGSIPGSSFFCSNDFPYWNESHTCYKSNYNLLSNGIFFLDVEIRGKTVRGFISDAQRDLSDMDDPYLPRHLIAEMQWSNELDNLRPTRYWLSNEFITCGSLSQFISFNFAPEVYNKRKRIKTSLGSSSSYKECAVQDSLIVMDWNNGIAIYITKPTPVGRNIKSLSYTKN